MSDVTIRTLRIKLDADGTLVVSGVESAKRKLGELGGQSQTISQRMQGHWQAFRTHWLGVTAAITAGFLAMRKAWDLMSMAAKFEEQKDAVAALSAQYEISADQMIRSIQSQARGMVSLAEAANIAARSLNLGFAPEQILQMVMVAERFSDVLGNDLVQATVDLAQAIGTQQTRMLKQLGIVIDAEDAYRRYAAQIGKVADELSNAEKRAAFFNEFMLQAEGRVKALGEAVDSMDDKFTQMEKRWEDAKLAVGGFLIDVLLTLEAGMGAVVGFVSSAVASVIRGMAEVQSFLGRFGITFETDLMATWAKVDDFSRDAFDRMKKDWDMAWSDAADAPVKAVQQAQQQIDAAALPDSMKPGGPDSSVHVFSPDMRAGLESDAEAALTVVGDFYNNAALLGDRYRQGEVEDTRITEEEKLQIVSNALGSFATLFQTLANIQGAHQGAAFALFKAFAIAQAVIDTHAGYMRAIGTYGPTPWGFIAAAAAVAAGIARVAAIASTQPNTGTTAVASSVGPGTPGLTPPAGQTAGGSSGPQIINIHLVSRSGYIDRNALDNFARDLAPSIRRARGDGFAF